MANTAVELIQFRMSHYNEKARWALDFKQVPHSRRTLLPGPHRFVVKRLTGQTKTPVVRFGETAVHGSADIIDELERRFPSPPLYPEETADRTRALEIQDWLDGDIGPRIRRAALAAIVDDAGQISRTFAADRSLPVRSLYRVMLPVARGMIKKGNGLTGQASVEDGYAAAAQALDFVVSQAGDDGYLVGGRFSVADLTAAALLAPAANPPDSPMTRPTPLSAPVAAWLDRWKDHPGTAWVHRQYRRHRPPSAQLH